LWKMGFKANFLHCCVFHTYVLYTHVKL
jgi:hypothetical protein